MVQSDVGPRAGEVGTVAVPSRASEARGYPPAGERPVPAPRPESPEPAPAFVLTALDHVDEAVVAVDSGGVVRATNAVAATLLPGIAVGQVVAGRGALAEAMRAPSATFEIDHDDRRLAGRLVVLDGLAIWYVRDVSEHALRMDALLAERWRSSFLAESGRRLATSLHPDRTARTAAHLAVPALADVAVVIRREAGNRLRWYRYASEDGVNASGVVAAGDPGRAPSLFEALAGASVEDDPRLAAELPGLDWALPVGFGPVGSALAIALPGPGAPAGLLVVARPAGRAGFEPAERHLARQYAARVGAAVTASTLYAEQAQIAEVLQRSLIPAELPSVPGLALGAAYRPARERLRIGGDFYDVAEAGDGTWTFALGDVCGKGVEAAVQTGEVRHMLHALRRTVSDPGDLLERLNDALLSMRSSRLTTLVAGAVIPGAGHVVRIRLGIAGHPPPLIVRADGEVSVVDSRGMVLGAFADAWFGAAEIVLAPGDTLVVYSDGVTEARGGPDGATFFGRDRLVSVLSGYGGVPAGAVAEHVAERTADWLGGREHDDIAVLALQVRPRRPARHLHAVESL